jgi:hypothetical protein
MTAKQRPIPAHGTEARYGRGCHCRPCTRKAVQADQLRILDRLQGRPRRVASAPVIAHLGALRGQGMSWEEIGRAARTSASTPREIVLEQRAEVHRSTAEKLLAVPLSHRPSEVGMVPSLGAMRRVRALYVIGCSRSEIANRASVSEYTISLLASGRWSTIRVQHDQAIRHAYRQMWMQPGNSAKNRIRARREGWVSPLAWDDIDNPEASPVAMDRAPAGKQATAAARAENITYLASFGVAAHEIAERVGLDVSYVRAQIDGTRAPGWRQRQEVS